MTDIAKSNCDRAARGQESVGEPAADSEQIQAYWACGRMPSEITSSADLIVGDFVRVSDDGRAILSACRSLGLGTRYDHLRLAALGHVGFIKNRLFNGTALVHFPTVGDVLFPIASLNFFPMYSSIWMQERAILSACRDHLRLAALGHVGFIKNRLFNGTALVHFPTVGDVLFPIASLNFFPMYSSIWMQEEARGTRFLMQS